MCRRGLRGPDVGGSCFFLTLNYHFFAPNLKLWCSSSSLRWHTGALLPTDLCSLVECGEVHKWRNSEKKDTALFFCLFHFCWYHLNTCFELCIRPFAVLYHCLLKKCVIQQLLGFFLSKCFYLHVYALTVGPDGSKIVFFVEMKVDMPLSSSGRFSLHCSPYAWLSFLLCFSHCRIYNGSLQLSVWMHKVTCTFLMTQIIKSVVWFQVRWIKEVFLLSGLLCWEVEVVRGSSTRTWCQGLVHCWLVDYGHENWLLGCGLSLSGGEAVWVEWDLFSFLTACQIVG